MKTTCAPTDQKQVAVGQLPRHKPTINEVVQIVTTSLFTFEDGVDAIYSGEGKKWPLGFARVLAIHFCMAYELDDIESVGKKFNRSASAVKYACSTGQDMSSQQCREGRWYRECLAKFNAEYLPVPVKKS